MRTMSACCLTISLKSAASVMGQGNCGGKRREGEVWISEGAVEEVAEYMGMAGVLRLRIAIHNESCCSAQDDNQTRRSTTVAPPPPSLAGGSATDSTCGCFCKYCRRAFRRMPMPLP